MTVIAVSNRSELQKALGSASGGDTIVLKDGDYGTINISAKFASAVTITAENPQGATFDQIIMNKAANLSFSDIQVDVFAAYYSDGVALSDSEVDGLVYMRDVDGLTVTNNDIDGGFHAMLLNGVRDFSVTDNKIHTAQEDLMRITGNSYNGLVEGNYFFDTQPEDYRDEGGGYNHSDFIQMFGVNGETPHDITIRRNLMYDDRDTGDKTVTPQGIFISDPGAGGYSDLLIEENLIAVNSVNSIYINGGEENVVVQNNTLIPLNGGGAIIRLAEKAGYDNSGTTVTGNVMKILYDETKSSNIGDNFIYGRDADLSALFQGTGAAWSDFIPVVGSELEALEMGAVDFIADLLNEVDAGGGSEQPATETPTTETPSEPSTGDSSGGVTEPEPEEPVMTEKVVFSRAGALEVQHAIDVVELAATEDLAIESGTISLNFNADRVTGWSGVLSKDAAGYTGGGNHFTIYVANGTLNVRFQDGQSDVILTAENIQTHKTYNVEVSFGDGQVAAWLNGELIGEADFDMSWVNNGEHLQLGALGWSSETGKAGYKGVFDGTISDVEITTMTADAFEFGSSTGAAASVETEEVIVVAPADLVANTQDSDAAALSSGPISPFLAVLESDDTFVTL